MIVNSTDMQNNFGKYLEMATDQEIVITRNGTAVARLVGMQLKERSLSEQLRGIIPLNVSEKAIKSERMARQ